MEVKEEVLDILRKVWIKLQDLPQASRLELGAFFVLILFVGKCFSVNFKTQMRSEVEGDPESELSAGP